MYIDTVPNRGSPPAVLLRESFREGSRTRKRTLANLSHWPDEQVEALRRVLKGEPLVPVDELFTIERSLPHGHVRAVLGTMRKLGLEQIIASKPSRERNLIVALVVERILHPGSKLASTRTWKHSTIAEDMGSEETDVEEVYLALDWLLKRQQRIEKKLAGRCLGEGGLALYDLSSSTYYGRKCPLARRGHNRDGKKAFPCIAYGLLTDAEGRPVSVQVYPGNTGDPSTVMDQIDKLQRRFHLSHVVLVGDRGMLTDTQIDHLREHPGLGWISALRSSQIRQLVESEMLQMSLFDEQNLAEISSPDFPGERLVACFNPILAEERKRKRKDLLEATEQELSRIARDVARRTKTPLTKVEIAIKVGKKINRYKVAKHFELKIDDGHFSWKRREDSIRRETALDGIYVIRTSEPEEQLSADDAVRNYKRLTQVERAFRCLKGFDLRIRPIWLRLEDHVRAHIFLCMLAYTVEWAMRRVWAPLLFEDEELENARNHRDPVAPAKPSSSVKRKKATRQTEDGLPLNSFSSLLDNLATVCRNTCRMKSARGEATLQRHTKPTRLQQRAFDLLGV